MSVSCCNSDGERWHFLRDVAKIEPFVACLRPHFMSWCGCRCANAHVNVATESYVAVTKMSPADGSPYGPVIPDCLVTIASDPTSGFGAGITLTSLRTPPDSTSAFQVFDGDSFLSTVLGTFGTGRVYGGWSVDWTSGDWLSGIQFVGSTTAGEAQGACPHIMLRDACWVACTYELRSLHQRKMQLIVDCQCYRD
jgi:hypothetical protein